MSVTQLGGPNGWTQYLPHASNNTYDFVNGTWSGQSLGTAYLSLTSVPVASYLMNINRQTFEPTSTPAAPTNPTFYEASGGANAQGVQLLSRPNQLRITDTIKIKSIQAIVELQYSVPSEIAYTNGGITGLVPNFDDRGYVNVNVSILRVRGTNQSLQETFELPVSALAMKRPKWMFHDSLLDSIASDQKFTGAVQVVAKAKHRFKASLVSQRKYLRVNWFPKNPKLFRYMLNSVDPDPNPQHPMKEGYFLHMYTDSPSSANQYFPVHGGARILARHIAKVKFCDAQI